MPRKDDIFLGLVKEGVNTTTPPVLDSEVQSLRARGITLPSQSGYPGLLWAFGGDSITNGSSASNFTYSYSSKAVYHVGSLIARPDFISAGKPGDTSAGLLSRMNNIINGGAQAIVIMIGTNDAGTGVSIDTYVANLTAIINTAKFVGMRVVLCTVPPRGSGANASLNQTIAAYNAFIRTYGPSLDCVIADVHSVLVDPTQHYMLASYNSGDDTHPNDAGHNAMAKVVANAMILAARTPSKIGLIRNGGTPDITNLVQDPLCAGGTTQPAGWFEQPGGTGTAPVYSLVADTSSVLPAGQWAQMDFDGTTSGGLRRLASNGLSTSLWSVGDTLLFTEHIQIEDTSGTWEADVLAGNSSIGSTVVNQSGVGIFSPLNRAIGRKNSAGFYDIGPIAYTFTVPAGTTGMNIWHGLSVPTGKHYKMRVGCIGVLNLTQLGLLNQFNWGQSGAVFINT